MEVTTSERSYLSGSAEWQLVERIVSSSGFRKSPLLKSFLFYICEQKLCGKEEELSEFQIGVRALRRPVAYNPGDDNIVRNYARILRRRLNAYFEENPHERLRVSVPIGSYVPNFELAQTAQYNMPEVAEKIPTGQETDSLAIKDEFPTRWLSRRVRVLSIVGVVCVVILGSILIWQRVNSPEALYRRFWGEVFDRKRTTFVVTTDSGFALLQDLTGQNVHLPDYVTNRLQEKFSNLDLSQDPKRGRFGVSKFAGYTSSAGLDTILRLAATPEFNSGHPVVRSARDVRMDDLNHSNAVFLGGPHANPWVELFDSVSDFHIDFPTQPEERIIGRKWIVDSHPEPGAPKSYANDENGESHKTYAILAFLPSIDKNGFALLSEGQNIAGTAAAAEFALDRNTIGPILKRAQLSDGSIGPFQLLLETTVVGAKAPEARVVIARYGLRK